ncbi:MAG: ferrous iron transport protein B [Phycisphaerae bacterium]|nr:ferrous iron transport protein B [Phycisphaerae bacterium]
MASNDAPRRITVALAGNPNAGKTTVFNAMTGARQHVGNYPGVTVEKKVGRARGGDTVIEVVDLPGTYSLSARSAEQVVARNYLIDERPDVVIDVVDASNLERNLYLALNFIELGVPVILAFNMWDVAQGRGLLVETAELARLLGVPIVPTVAHKGRGIEELLDAAVAMAGDRERAVAEQARIGYGAEVEPHVTQLAERIAAGCDSRRPRWFALKLLEDDAPAQQRLGSMCPDEAGTWIAEAGRLRRHIEHVCGQPAEVVLADRRYGFIAGACARVVHREQLRRTWSDRIDTVLTNRWLGLPIFAVLMYLVFQVTFALGNPIVGALDAGLATLAGTIRDAWVGGGLLRDLLVDGVLGGVGAVLVFLPLIVFLYMAIALLEDTGYMARAAFLLDHWMQKIGLHGKSFIPMLIGFGCTVPAVLATRTLETRRDRLTTILVLPLMSCGARLPIYVLILGAFFPARTLWRPLGLFDVTNQAVILFGLYALGVLLAIICAKLFRLTLLRGRPEPLVLELPPYRTPTVRGVIVHMVERAWEYVRKAGTIILAIVIVLWALKTWPALPEDRIAEFDRRADAVRAREDLSATERAEALARVRHRRREAEREYSAIGRIGRGIAPAMRPCGFDWKIATAAVGAFAAKEVFVSQMGVIHAIGPDTGADSNTLQDILASTYTSLQGMCIMLWALIATPCMATVAVTVRESGSWKWALLQFGYLTVLAWIVAAVVYQVGSALGFGA